MVVCWNRPPIQGQRAKSYSPNWEEQGLTPGVNFFLAFSPERVDPGRQDWTTLNTPKVIGELQKPAAKSPLPGTSKPAERSAGLLRRSGRDGKNCWKILSA